MANKITADEVSDMLFVAGLRHAVQAIDDTDDGVVMWAGMGYPVDSMYEALRIAREIDASL